MSEARTTPPTGDVRRSASGFDITPLSRAEVERLTRDLPPLERYVTCEAGTEQPGTGKYLKNKEPGTYVCAVCSLPLFRSTTKFESGTGWPSFFQPYDPEHLEEIRDTSHGMIRTEVRCARSGTHLGHVFEDGPPPSGLRYCINSVALQFIPEGEPLPERYRPATSPGGEDRR